MNLRLSVRFFKSALSNDSAPDFHPSEPLQVGLLVGEGSGPIGVELLEMLGSGGEMSEVAARVLDGSTAGDLEEGAECFLIRSGRMLGRGTVTTV